MTAGGKLDSEERLLSSALQNCTSLFNLLIATRFPAALSFIHSWMYRQTSRLELSSQVGLATDHLSSCCLIQPTKVQKWHIQCSFCSMGIDMTSLNRDSNFRSLDRDSKQAHPAAPYLGLIGYLDTPWFWDHWRRKTSGWSRQSLGSPTPATAEQLRRLPKLQRNSSRLTLIKLIL